MHVDVRIDEVTHNLLVVFPDVYPYTRFEVIAPELSLPRHQNPFQKNLCLIGRSTANWNVDDTLANFLVERFPKTLAVATSEDKELQRREEEPQGEPFSDHYLYNHDASLLVDSAWQLSSKIREGKMRLGLESFDHPIRGAVLEVFGSGNVVIARAPAALMERFPKTAWGRWVRRDAPVAQNDPHSFLNALAADDAKLRQKKLSTQRPPPPDIIGVVFPEEIQQGSISDGWVFLARGNDGIALVRAARGGPSDVRVRTPELDALRDKSVAVLGLGSLGAASALELARAGIGELLLADFDHVEAGTISRWPLGISAIGRKKTEVVQAFIQQNYPYTSVKTFPGMIGGALDRGYSDLKNLESLYQAALVFDATAELGLQHLLSDLAIEFGKPYICVSATAGAWGGLVARIRPGITQGCWVCLQHAINKNEIVIAPEKPDGFVQPPGCASPTFTGAGFDTSIVAEVAVRMAVATLSDENLDWDVEAIDLRNRIGKRIPLVTRAYQLNRQSECKSALHKSLGTG